MRRLTNRQFSLSVLAFGGLALVLGFVTAALGASRIVALLVCVVIAGAAAGLLVRRRP